MIQKRSLTALFVVAVAVVVLAGGLMASNMGFKLNKVITDTSEAGSNSGTDLIGLPYNRQVGIDMASELFADIASTGIELQNLQRYETLTDTTQVYSFGSPDFALEEGQGLIYKTNPNQLNPPTYISVGSHNPSAVIQLEAAGAASNSGTNLFAPPWHATASMASELFAEIGSTNVQNIQKYLTESDTTQVYSFGSADFAIEPGKSYLIKMGQTVAYSPSHY